MLSNWLIYKKQFSLYLNLARMRLYKRVALETVTAAVCVCVCAGVKYIPSPW